MTKRCWNDKKQVTYNFDMIRILRSFFFNFLLYFLIVVGIIVGLPKFLSWKLNTPYPMAAITSGSMWPALSEGDLVFIEGTEKKDLHVGDIIVFRNAVGGTFTIHRIVRLEEDTLVTKGDANFSEDEPVPYARVVGKNPVVFGYQARIPKLGIITVFATNFATK